MSARSAKWLAWTLWTAVVSLTGASILLMLVNASYPGVSAYGWWLGNATVVVDVTVGAIVASRRPENPVGWLICAFGVAVSLSSFTAQYALYALLARPGEIPFGEVAAWVTAWQLPLLIGLQAFYILLFPTGRLPGPGWRVIAALLVAFILGGSTLAAFTPDAYLGAMDSISNPLGIAGFTVYYEMLIYVAAPVLFLLAAVSVFARLRRASGVERQQIKWFAYAAATNAVGTLLNVLALALEAQPLVARIVAVVFVLSGNVVPVAIGIAILRYRLYDIDRIINRTLVYGLLTLILAGAYFGSVVSIQSIHRAATGEGSQITIVISTLVIAALFNPLRRRIQTFVDRRFYRQKYDGRIVLEALSKRLRDETDLERLAGDLVSVVRQTVRPRHVGLWIRETEKERDV